MSKLVSRIILVALVLCGKCAFAQSMHWAAASWAYSNVSGGGTTLPAAGAGVLLNDGADNLSWLTNTGLQSAVRQTSPTLKGLVAAQPLDAPATVGVVATGSGATIYAYAVVAFASSGGNYPGETGTSGTVTNAATLDGTNYNTVTWTAVPGVFEYRVYRETGESGDFFYVATTNSATVTLVDNGLAASAAVPPNAAGVFFAGRFAGSSFGPDEGTGGTAGLVPAPDTGDAAAGKVLHAGTTPWKAVRPVVTPNTSGPITVTTGDVGRLYTNEGASGSLNHALPAAAAELHYWFCVVAAQTLQVTALGDDTISIGASTSGAAGNITNATPYSCIHLIALNATRWVAVATTGTWTVSP